MIAENQRLIEVCEKLIEQNEANSLSKIAVLCGKSNQYFTDLKKVKKFSRDFLEVLIGNFPEINKDYVLHGIGEMINNDDKNKLREPESIYGCLKCKEKDVLINQLIGENNVLREQLNLPIPERNKKAS